MAEEDEGLLAALKARRRALADAAGVPAYVIFPDRTLIEMASRRPATLDDLAGITGVGAVKLERFGAAFLAVIAGALRRRSTRRAAPRRRGPERRSSTGCRRRRSRSPAAPTGSASRSTAPPATLALIAETRPATLDDARARSQGMGPQKAERFGAAFLAILRADHA